MKKILIPSSIIKARVNIHVINFAGAVVLGARSNDLTISFESAPLVNDRLTNFVGSIRIDSLFEYSIVYSNTQVHRSL